MRRPYLRSAARRALLASTILPAFWLAARPVQVRAQGSISVYVRDKMTRDADTEREMEIKRMEAMRNARRPGSPEAKLALAQIAEDFRQMQLVNNEMMRASFSDEKSRALDYEHISKATAEISRRAARLKANLQLPAQDSNQARTAERELAGERELRASLLSLDELIMGFVNNPTFRQQGTLNAQHSARASRDLAAIIQLSQKIKQRAEKLKG